ncbi:DUF2711 family protein [Paenisporosarcina sp. OV554]|uniref:DUF2711 family protein n=1 Tax=Paenisporosarcina sp. OV554 TaxID=2135694 RepID=UPI000D3884F8|nr:DUF2711 family protein [Paenisporosarcina sp. OV554]PUB08210.1 uncharacterized protein DUF2711 [Paenisporosarcina sp. OV554]
MLEYIQLDVSPILSQISNHFKSAAFLLHPFVQMPDGWEKRKRERPFQHIYPSDEEILNIGKPVSWNQISQQSDLTLQEVGIAVHDHRDKRPDLTNQLRTCFNSDFYYPREDKISVFLLNDIVNVLGSKGADFVLYSAPLEGEKGRLKIEEIKLEEMSDLTPAEFMLMDDKLEFAFISEYDAYTTLFLTKDDNISEIIRRMNWEATICDNKTTLNWFSQKS